MHKPIVLIGTGEMGGVFARAFLRRGYPVYPINRAIPINETHELIANPQMVLVAVGENDLHAVLSQMPESWSDKLCLLQNELLPNDWQGFPEPTIISVWFEKKPGIEAKVIIPSPVYGPQANLVSQALSSLDIPTRVLSSENDLLFELVLKNLYILTSNIAGLKTGGTVGELWTRHREFARTIAGEVIQIQQALTDTRFDAEALIHAMLKAFDGDPAHQCMGRSAPARLSRVLEHADRFGLGVPTLRQLQTDQPAA
ncbi:MAG: hypothetical protein QNJ78_05760 [Gammaproteobacteria bacterium]|nr:hypothetical protein [Gammaproteobacteria bacterium]